MKVLGYAQIVPEETTLKCTRCKMVFDTDRPEDRTFPCPYCDHENDAFNIEHSIAAQARRISMYVRDELRGVSDASIKWSCCEPTKRFGIRDKGMEILNDIGRDDCLVAKCQSKGVTCGVARCQKCQSKGVTL